MRPFHVASLVLLSSFAAACSADVAGPDPIKTAKSPLARDTAPVASTLDVAAVAKDNAAFAFDLYHQSSKSNPSGNAFFSPYSITIALGMTYAGARADTATAMAKTLHFNAEATKLHATLNAIDLSLMSRGQGALGQDGKGFRLRVANSVWAQDGMPFEQPFLDTLAVNYGAGVTLADFVGNPEKSRTQINQWVSDKTEGKIQNLLTESLSDTKMVLVNAIYFNAKWATPFEVQSTHPGPFTTADGSSVNASFMAQTEGLPYAETDDVQAVDLSYDGGDTSMLVVVPKEGHWAAAESSISGASYGDLVAKLQSAPVSLELPKFKIAGDTVSLKDDLSALGMGIAFSGGADFSGIVNPAVEKLFIGDVKHKAYVSVNEQGTEAAAATAVDLKAGAINPEGRKTVTANRPFFFFIRDVPTGSLLFVGRVTNPS